MREKTLVVYKGSTTKYAACNAAVRLVHPCVIPTHAQVLDSFSVERTYILFRTMGVRHLVVIDEHNHVRGIVTRKDLLGFRLGERLKSSGECGGHCGPVEGPGGCTCCKMCPAHCMYLKLCWLYCGERSSSSSQRHISTHMSTTRR